MILLEDGPKDAEQLAAWLEQPLDLVAAELAAMGRDFLVKRMGFERRWALTEYQAPSERPHLAKPAAARTAAMRSAQIDDEPDLEEIHDDSEPPMDQDATIDDDLVADRPMKRLAPASAGTSWWVGKESREEFAAAARARDAEMSTNKTWRQGQVSFDRFADR